MIDYLFGAKDEATLIASIGSYNPDGFGNLHQASGWRPDICFPCQAIDNSNPSSPVVLSPFGLWIGLISEAAFLNNNANCLLVTDRTLGFLKAPNYVLHSKFTSAQLNNYYITPIIAGCWYPFLDRMLASAPTPPPWHP